MKILLSLEAESDLEAIGLFIAQDNPARAISFLSELRAKCEALAELPRGFPRVPRYGDAEVRRRMHGNYAIFYRVDDRTVTILHILHGARDYAAILFPD